MDCKPPTIAGWHRVIFDKIPTKCLTHRSKCMIKILYKIWPLLLEFIGSSLVVPVLKGMVDHRKPHNVLMYN